MKYTYYTSTSELKMVNQHIHMLLCNVYMYVHVYTFVSFFLRCLLLIPMHWHVQVVVLNTQIHNQVIYMHVCKCTCAYAVVLSPYCSDVWAELALSVTNVICTLYSAENVDCSDHLLLLYRKLWLLSAPRCYKRTLIIKSILPSRY